MEISEQKSVISAAYKYNDDDDDADNDHNDGDDDCDDNDDDDDDADDDDAGDDESFTKMLKSDVRAKLSIDLSGCERSETQFHLEYF